MIVIGSTAIKYFFPDFPREPIDLDVFSAEPVEGAEVFWDPGLTSPGMSWWFRTRFSNHGKAWYALPDELYTLKLSHAYWDLGGGSWEKHMSDLMFLKNKGCHVVSEVMYQALYQIWEKHHGKKRVNLQMDKDAFFSDAVQRKYDHDSVHVSVAYGDRPLYESFLSDDASVSIDMGKVRAADQGTQIALFREEVYATALERWIIPSDYRFSPRKAYAWALKKTIVSLTKGWSARFIAENYDQFYQPDMDYVARHRSRKHLLEPFKEESASV